MIINYDINYYNFKLLEREINSNNIDMKLDGFMTFNQIIIPIIIN